jgi:alpha-beta hydrolase superfamily lysophospholipase
MVKMPHPSGQGYVHSGFWAMYCGIREQVMERILREVRERSPSELVLTGHSVGGSLVYLFLLDLLAKELEQEPSMISKMRLKITVFGIPRTGDGKLVDHFRSLVLQFRQKFRLDDSFLEEYSVQGYNDGMSSVLKKVLFTDFLFSFVI